MSSHDPAEPIAGDPSKDPPTSRQPVVWPRRIKPYRHAILKNQPEALQNKIYQRSKTQKDEAIVAWLQKKHRIKVSRRTVNRFIHDFPLSRYLQQVRSRAKKAAKLRLKNPELDRDAEAVAKLGQIIFEQIALNDHDIRIFVQLRKLRLEEQKLNQNERRIFLQEKKAAQNEPPDPTTRLTAEEYDQKLKEILDLA